MIHNCQAIVLWSKRSREADKLVCVYTREIGRVWARAVSAAKSVAKFVALTEPFVESDLSLYIRSSDGWAKVVGGQLRQTFPRTRLDLEKATAAAWMCEVVYRLTPEHHASEPKFDLLIHSLEALESARRWEPLRLAFAVRFLDLAGFGLENQPVWKAFESEFPTWASDLKTKPLPELCATEWDSGMLQALERLAGEVVHHQLNRPLNVNRFRQETGILL